MTTKGPAGMRFSTMWALVNLKAPIGTKVYGTQNTSVGVQNSTWGGGGAGGSFRN